ncbi:MAG: glycosyltransferase family 2 protein [Nostoc sp. JL31]|uniref:glycosyltransferase family 2 protein n=1 Tax=Nostoc sp. JL31 TaxID=2815395 RepID=UPI0025F300B1|nr:glycosyltransferase family A protein [Nostoc sp. JL31]MBN3888726.1 glycosyltransferase family 2 protein [Nostoc sp. JL31]
MPKVSIVIPAYNSLKFLPETMESVFKQTFKDFEVLVVNDGSSDDTEHWVSQIADPRVKLITQENQGLSGARNTGIAHASGEYIAFLDADDLWEPTKLEKQVLCLEENSEIGLVYTWVSLIDENGNFTGRVFKNYAENDVWHKLIEHNIVESGSVAMVRRQCFDTCGLFDRNLRSFVEDWDMWLRIASRYPFKVMKEPLVYYRQHSTSASKNWEAMARSFEIVIEKAFSAAPPELQYLKNRSYGFANLCLAWKPLQSRAQDWKIAASFRAKALSHYPWICFSQEFVRLSIAIILMRLFGTDGYQIFLSYAYTLRQRIVAMAR